MGTTREVVLNSRRTTTITKEEEKKLISLNKWRKMKIRTPRRRK